MNLIYPYTMFYYDSTKYTRPPHHCTAANIVKFLYYPVALVFLGHLQKTRHMRMHFLPRRLLQNKSEFFYTFFMVCYYEVSAGQGTAVKFDNRATFRISAYSLRTEIFCTLQLSKILVASAAVNCGLLIIIKGNSTPSVLLKLAKNSHKLNENRI